MKVQKIKNRSILFTYDMSDWDLNIQLILGEKYDFVIDSGLGSLCVEPILEYLGNRDKPLFVINTHYHWDHIWGNSSLTDCTIISHKLCREMILTEWDSMFKRNSRYCRGETGMCLPDMVFEKDIHFPEDQIRIFHTPGHTVDSISVLDEKDRVLNAGDNIGDSMEEIVPGIFDKETYIRTLEKYKEMSFDLCLSGHNGILKKDVIDIILSKI